MIVLQPVIQVRELPPARAPLRQHLPSLRDLVRPTPTDREAEILSYLSQGVVCGIYNDRGLVYDVLRPGERIEQLVSRDSRFAGLVVQPSLLLTDGTWVWPGVLPYYVAAYHLELPARFVLFAEGRQWAIDPATIDPSQVNWDRYDSVEQHDTVAATP